MSSNLLWERKSPRPSRGSSTGREGGQEGMKDPNHYQLAPIMSLLRLIRSSVNLDAPLPKRPLPSTTGVLAALPDTLDHLYEEYERLRYQHQHHHHHHQGRLSATLPEEQQPSVIRQLLTLRHPSQGPLPSSHLKSIEDLLLLQSARDPDPLLDVAAVPTLPAQLYHDQSTIIHLPAAFSRLSIVQGSLLRLSSPSLAIVNPANVAMLGCFQPTHLCVDNLIHAAAGPQLRSDCARIMKAAERSELETSEPILTKGYELEAGYVVHVAGPQLRKGAVPTQEDEELLAKAYSASLDLTLEAGCIDAVAFPCISTGLFAFPAELAAAIALRTVVKWLDAHPTADLRVILVLYSDSDVDHYSNALRQLYPALPSPRLIVTPPTVPEDVIRWVKEADSVIIHAGAGLSADAVHPTLGHGLDYTSESLFTQLYPGLLKSTSLRTLYHTIGYEWKDRNAQWAFILAHGHNVLNWGPTPLYDSLLALARSKSSYAVLTSNADTLFGQSEFDPLRVWTPQGSYANFQCLKPCRKDAFFPSRPWFEKAAPFYNPETMRLADDAVIPTCAFCGGEVFLNVRGGDWFLDAPQAGQKERYLSQVESMVDRATKKGKHVVLLEIGAGFNTPSVVRWPSEELVDQHRGLVKLVRINIGHPEVPITLEREDARGLRMEAGRFLQAVEASADREA